MKCPNCQTANRGAAGITIREQGEIDVAMSQQRRTRRCQDCGHEWETLEMLLPDVIGLRRLAHAQVMASAREARK